MTSLSPTDITASIWQRWPRLYPYAQLARWDRPVGIWLLYWPCVWGLCLASGFRALESIEQLRWLLLFFIGAVAMRGAGCTLNDMTDRKLDSQVERTKARPLASGAVTLYGAGTFLILQSLIGLYVLIQLPVQAIVLGLGTVPLIAAYPWMKRIIYWPQLLLGIIFNSGVMIAYAALENDLTWPDIVAPLFIYAAGIVWTLAYDSVYAMMDSIDDATAGIKSTVLLWGANSKVIIGWLWVLNVVLFLIGLACGAGYDFLSYALVLGVLFINIAAHLYWSPLNNAYSLMFFKLQTRMGLLLAMALAVPVLL